MRPLKTLEGKREDDHHQICWGGLIYLGADNLLNSIVMQVVERIVQIAVPT